jgi:hypothetical protein
MRGDVLQWFTRRTTHDQLAKALQLLVMHWVIWMRQDERSIATDNVFQQSTRFATWVGETCLLQSLGGFPNRIRNENSHRI